MAEPNGNDRQPESIEESMERMKTQILNLRHHVLNNIDICHKGKYDDRQLDLLVKRPMVKALSIMEKNLEYLKTKRVQHFQT